jgi:hypothetical protein
METAGTIRFQIASTDMSHKKWLCRRLMMKSGTSWQNLRQSSTAVAKTIFPDNNEIF